MKQVIFGASAIVLIANAGSAAPSDIISSRRADYYLPGIHQFYLWCASGSDRIAYRKGSSAQDALTQINLSTGLTGIEGCRPVWQGRISS